MILNNNTYLRRQSVKQASYMNRQTKKEAHTCCTANMRGLHCTEQTKSNRKLSNVERSIKRQTIKQHAYDRILCDWHHISAQLTSWQLLDHLFKTRLRWQRETTEAYGLDHSTHVMHCNSLLSPGPILEKNWSQNTADATNCKSKWQLRSYIQVQ